MVEVFKDKQPLVVEDTHDSYLTIHISITDLPNVPFKRDCFTPKFNYNKTDLEGLNLALNRMDLSGVLETRKLNLLAMFLVLPEMIS